MTLRNLWIILRIMEMAGIIEKPGLQLDTR
jgi:hypothetical protein